MAEKPKTPAPKKEPPDRWGFLTGIKTLLSAFPHATTGQQVVIVAMCLGAVMFIGLGLVGSVALPAWAVVTMFVLAALLIFSVAVMLFIVEQRTTAPVRCRHVPVYPPDEAARRVIRGALEEIRKDAADQIRAAVPTVTDGDIRANIFLLAPIVGGAADGTWKLVIHPDFAANMNDPRELGLQFSVGQGATGVAYRDGTYQLTRRLAAPPKKGQWDRKFQMTPALSAQINERLKWIVTFPLLKPDTNEAVGVLNIDGLSDVPDDNTLHTMASSVREKVQAIARNLSLQRSTCVRIDQLGVMEHV